MASDGILNDEHPHAHHTPLGGLGLLDETTFDYLKPTSVQLSNMDVCRQAAKAYALVLESTLPDGPDKTYCLRKLREVAMWANVACTRLPNGTPRP